MKVKKKNKTVGEASLDLQLKSENEKGPNAIDLEREIRKGTNSKKSFEEEVWEAVDRAKADPCVNKSFYIVVLLKKERLLKNVIRQLFFYRNSCPTPEYDQSVYKYHPDCDELEFIWTVPDKSACLFLPQMVGDLPPDQRLLLSMVAAFNAGDLDKKAKELNGESEEWVKI